jgi:hypothetical protein
MLMEGAIDMTDDTSDNNEKQIHVATLMRLQVADTALGDCVHAMTGAFVNMRELLQSVKASESLTEEYLMGLRETIANAEAALEVTRGRSTQIPASLRRNPILWDEQRTHRFLSIPAGS